ncbi:hypothetical protein [Bacteroides acidifaciens]|uniref:hypothetical protein n=1 Tax=Bacteroides acidifaciens TaxID=85831 RepID=UPI003F68C4C2
MVRGYGAPLILHKAPLGTVLLTGVPYDGKYFNATLIKNLNDIGIAMTVLKGRPASAGARLCWCLVVAKIGSQAY